MTSKQRVEIKDRARFEGDKDALNEAEHVEFLENQIIEEEGHNASVEGELYE